jgi:hypothetical protein
VAEVTMKTLARCSFVVALLLFVVGAAFGDGGALGPGTLPGDADLNGTVNGDDLGVVLSNYNQTGMNWAHGDFDGDGMVNGPDLNVLLSHYNESVGVGAAVPEPSALLLLGIGAIALFARAWRRWA